MSDHHHFIIHKPYGYLSQFKNNSKRKKMLLSDLYDFAEGTMAIGRLDVKSEGLLFLTTNGKLSHKVRSAKIEKEYFVQVDGYPTEKKLERLRKGITINIEGRDYQTMESKIEKIATPDFLLLENRKVRSERHGPMSWLSITLREGKFHQVRKMTAAIGHPTFRLIRYRIGMETLDQLKVGSVKKVAQFHLTSE